MRGILVVLAIGALLAAAAPCAAAEELFDTKAAAVHIEKGIADLKGKKYDAAVKELEEAVSINPDAEAYYYLGYAYYLKGRKGDAESRKKSIECFDKAYELNPSFKPARFKPADAAEAAGKHKAPEAGQLSEPTPTVPAEPAQQQPDQQAPAQDNPEQPSPPIKATDKVKNLL
jgi:tetratricopeptide (TPR) repeat protein